MTALKRFFFLPLLVVLPLLLAACGGGGPSDVTSQDGNITLTAPQGWATQTHFFGITLTNNSAAFNANEAAALPDNAALVTVSSAPYDGANDPLTALNMQGFDLTSVQVVLLGDNRAARFDRSGETDNMTAAVQLPNGRVYIVTAVARAGQLAQFNEQLTALMTSLRTPAPAS